MASSNSQLFSFLLFSLFFIIFFIYPSYASPDNINNVSKAQSHVKQKKVNLNLYYESLCPYCRNFIVTQLVKLFNTDLLNIVNLRLVPWGNAQVSKPNKTIICQRKHFNFIYCIENQGLHNKDGQHSNGADSVWKACSARLGMDQNLIKNCYDSGYGRKLLLNYATETDNLQPKHLFVPWVTVNNQPLYDKYEGFINYVCNAYKDKALVKACMSHSPKATEEERPISPVCYADSKGIPNSA
ncbi:Gamma interferon inducible lysosomal thiol reductase GILT [Corchorus olitorius]|uniref:Gamma interferon inducible lysosomal thiol reductase GILT n=1 Tax=Corchorus olitorius TaxID=93759 RepID=A0A1R3JS01_9ROSI|nr:Gamma interferon inducible lysosomal thiol reductase GILT [Corchorus olitorius]